MDEILTRAEAARYLRTRFGLRTTAASLATMASRGGSPRIFKIGRYANYRKSDLNEWALRQYGGLLDSTSSPSNSSAVAFFSYEEDLGDLPEFDYRNTGDPHFDEVTRLEEDGELQAHIDSAGEKYRRIMENI